MEKDIPATKKKLLLGKAFLLGLATGLLVDLPYIVKENDKQVLNSLKTFEESIEDSFLYETFTRIHEELQNFVMERALSIKN